MVNTLTLAGLLLDAIGAFLLVVPDLYQRGGGGFLRDSVVSRTPMHHLLSGWSKWKEGDTVTGDAAKELYFAVIPASDKDRQMVKYSEYEPYKITRPKSSQFKFWMRKPEIHNGEEVYSRTSAIHDFDTALLAESIVGDRVETRQYRWFTNKGIILILLGFSCQILSLFNLPFNNLLQLIHRFLISSTASTLHHFL